jgi:type IX secretion system PorP/SprF family membrane protein
MIIVLFFCSTQMFYSQEDGVVSLALPVRNSLKFNQFVINPTFSFVREQSKYISIYNKREWVQFEDAPQTYLVSYSGRFRENIGIGVGLFQQNYGVLTTFGGVFNFAYNVRLERESNLTFGINLGIYKSGINTGNVVTNFADPSLENRPSNLLLTVNPGINYGTTFLDFGVSVNNLVIYNIKTSELIQDDPQQSIQAHMMYTGYTGGYGFFDESKFSGLIKSEFRKDKTVVSGIAMLTVPKGIWAQVGYNNLYGASAGLGLNITNQISIEYSFEKALGDLSDFGPSHEITLAYKFKNKENYYYSGEDDVTALISPVKKRKAVSKTSKLEAEANRKLAIEAKAQAKLESETQANLEAKAKAQAKIRALAQVKLAAENKAKAEAEAQAKLAAEAQAKSDAEAETKIRALAQAKLAAENKAKAEAEAQAKLAAEAKAKSDAEAEAKALVDAEAKLEAENRAKAEAEAQAKLAAEAKAITDAEAEAKAAVEAEAKLEAENRAKAEAEAQAKLAAKADAEAKEKLISNPTDEIGKSMSALAKLTEDSKITQQELLTKLSEAVANKDKDLKDLKEENDLSEKGIYLEPKPFKSVTAENRALEALKVNIESIIKTRNKKIDELETLYNQRIKNVTDKNDESNQYYQKAITLLKSEQSKAIKAKTNLVSTLEDINIATEIERKRRIKRAAYDNEEDRYMKDKAVLNFIKQNTSLSSVPLKEEDFDFGEEQSSNIQILKNIENVENGYYLIVAVHNDIAKRDEFITKMVSAGEYNVDFFYDLNKSKYFIYYKKVDSIEAANEALKLKGSKPYNGKLSIIKIEN